MSEDTVCPGCRMMINGKPHIHYGGEVLVVDKTMYAKPVPTSDTPQVAVLHRIGTADVVFMFEPSFDSAMTDEILGEILFDTRGRQMTPKIMGALHNMLRDVMNTAVRDGKLARDYKGNWHYAMPERVEHHGTDTRQ